MTSLKHALTASVAAGAAVAAARAAHQTCTATLWAELAPVLDKFEKRIAPLFESAGQEDLYRERFGRAEGNRLLSIHAGKRFVEISLGYTFRGELVENEFRLPAAYLVRNVEEQLALDEAHYREALARLSRRQEYRDAAQARDTDLQEFARLAQVFKNDPEAMCAITNISNSNT